MRCALIGQVRCQEDIVPKYNQYFLAYPYKDEYEDMVSTISSCLEEFNMTPYKAKDEIIGKHILCKICKKMQESSFGFFDVSDQNPNVMLELGNMIGMGKPTILIKRRESKTITSDLGGIEYIVYANMKELEEGLNRIKPTIEGYVNDNIKVQDIISLPKPQLEFTPKEVNYLEVRKRPDVMSGTTWKIDTGCGRLFVTVNYDEYGIFEVFCQMGKSGGCALAQSEALNRIISMAFRAGIHEKYIIKQLQGIRCPSPLLAKGVVVLSCPDAIAKIIEKEIKKISDITNNNSN